MRSQFGQSNLDFYGKESLMSNSYRIDTSNSEPLLLDEKSNCQDLAQVKFQTCPFSVNQSFADIQTPTKFYKRRFKFQQPQPKTELKFIKRHFSEFKESLQKDTAMQTRKLKQEFKKDQKRFVKFQDKLVNRFGYKIERQIIHSSNSNFTRTIKQKFKT